MYTVKSNAEFLADLRALDPALKNIRLSSIEVERAQAKIRYNFICDQAVSEDLQNKILEQVETITSPAFLHVEVGVKKIVSNDQLVNAEIFKYLNDNYPSVSIFLKPTDIICTNVGDVVKYVLRLSPDGAEYVKKNGAIVKLNDFLAKTFCSDFAGSIEVKEAQESVSLLEEEVFVGELKKIEHRTIRVLDVVPIDDPTIGDVAQYIEDTGLGEATICGTVTDIVEKQAKNGKPFLIIHLDDTTGRTSGVYFSKKSTYHKIKDITIGECIIVRGNVSLRDGKKSFTFDKINRCTFPKNFVKKEKYKKQTPKNYKLIFPSPATTVKITSVFEDSSPLPKELTDETFVVFDLETTGLDVMNSGITEIGAVKVVNGKVTEQFTSLIKPDYHISDEIVSLTGITEELVKDSPKISMVIPDFMKFIEGATLVAHNAEFDLKFIKRFANAEDYEVKNKVLDTVVLARETLPFLKRHDLHTIADHFGIVFRHHRALSDAYATAEALIEMMRIKYK